MQNQIEALPRRIHFKHACIWLKNKPSVFFFCWKHYLWSPRNSFLVSLQTWTDSANPESAEFGRCLELYWILGLRKTKEINKNAWIWVFISFILNSATWRPIHLGISWLSLGSKYCMKASLYSSIANRNPCAVRSPNWSYLINSYTIKSW